MDPCVCRFQRHLVKRSRAERPIYSRRGSPPITPRQRLVRPRKWLKFTPRRQSRPYQSGQKRQLSINPQGLYLQSGQVRDQGDKARGNARSADSRDVTGPIQTGLKPLVAARNTREENTHAHTLHASQLTSRGGETTRIDVRIAPTLASAVFRGEGSSRTFKNFACWCSSSVPITFPLSTRILDIS
ncbi:hypothetical protein FQZ97_959390 [compost metagenome]